MCHDFVMANVSFAYDKENVINRMSFILPEKSMTALVGESGCGKTTITNLIARFYDAQEGAVEIGGINVREISYDALLRNISMVFQRVYLFNDTVYNNICFGKSDATMEEVESASKKACCHEFIMKLKDGYQTLIGEAGNTPSGGEKQRISIARAILKDTPIVLLDEATTSIDPENEKFIQEAINELVREKTLVVIAHRLLTIKGAGKILVISKGEIAESGTYDELMEKGKIYASFWLKRQKAKGWKISR